MFNRVRNESSRRGCTVSKMWVLAPLSLLSVASTAALAVDDSTPPTGSAATEPAGALPDGSSVPAKSIEAPASVSGSDETTGSVGGVEGNAQQIVANSSTNGIPSAALAAYQRAETVINAADKTCQLSWQLVAAIGRVESDHGRYGGNALDANGTARPGILGIALNGKNNTALIRDTDAGQYDNDTTFDRAVGPMQFIPSTWSVVGVDADNDGVRNPQDIDDAALATAVYLCSGNDDLSTLAGQRASVYRYNHSDSYVDLVLSIADNYLEGDFMSVPNGTTAAGFLSPDPTFIPGPSANNGPKNDGGGKPTAQQVTPSEGPTNEAPPEEPAPEPTQPPVDEPSLPLPPVTVPALPETSIAPVDKILTLAQAIVQCTLDGHVNNLLKSNDPFDVCVTGYITKG